jgi:hypothetical protein
VSLYRFPAEALIFAQGDRLVAARGVRSMRMDMLQMRNTERSGLREVASRSAKPSKLVSDLLSNGEVYVYVQESYTEQSVGGPIT